MSDPVNFSEARERLDDIVKQVRSKDVSLEKSLDLFDEAIKMGNSCFEMIDRIDSGDVENMSVTSEGGVSEGDTGLSEEAANVPDDTAERAETAGETTVDQQSDEGEPAKVKSEEDREETSSEDEPSANEDAQEQ